ncbi:MAG: TraB/GumN family protein [Desulfobacterales bacterium]|jgi:uncharacterized protein YbaP (TraB family)
MNKLNRYVLFFILIVICCPLNSRAAGNPFLWKIEGRAPSYLFGTIHFPDPRVTTLPESVENAFSDSQAVYTEISLDKANMLAQAAQMLLPGEQTLADIISEDLLSRTEEFIKDINPALTIEPFVKFKVWALAATLSLLEQQVNNPGAPALDAQLYDLAQQQGKRVGALETAEEQIAIFESLSIKEQIKMLRDTLDYMETAREKGVNVTEQFIEWYNQGDIENFGKLMMQYVKKDEFYKTFLQKVLHNRNQLMAERIATIIKTNPATSHFFAVGAGHFWGESAIQNILSKQGFEITRVGERARQMVAEEQKLTVPDAEKERLMAAGDEKQSATISDGQEKEIKNWYDRGILFSVYGNEKVAIQYFQKVIGRDPRRSDAYFQMGVSYGELGEYQKAVSLIDKAIELNSEKGVYYYGRARIYLLAGQKETALRDFKQAAAMGNRDAQNYLEKYADLDLKS